VALAVAVLALCGGVDPHNVFRSAMGALLLASGVRYVWGRVRKARLKSTATQSFVRLHFHGAVPHGGDRHLDPQVRTLPQFHV
jgi:hypothetical protein